MANTIEMNFEVQDVKSYCATVHLKDGKPTSVESYIWKIVDDWTRTHVIDVAGATGWICLPTGGGWGNGHGGLDLQPLEQVEIHLCDNTGTPIVRGDRLVCGCGLRFDRHDDNHMHIHIPPHTVFVDQEAAIARIDEVLVNWGHEKC